MDNYQQRMLEIEIENHRARIAQLLESLREMEATVESESDMPEQVIRQAEAMRIELKGRRAAFAIGAAHLKSLRVA